jgi:hypothetical protein
MKKVTKFVFEYDDRHWQHDLSIAFYRLLPVSPELFMPDAHSDLYVSFRRLMDFGEFTVMDVEHLRSLSLEMCARAQVKIEEHPNHSWTEELKQSRENLLLMMDKFVCWFTEHPKGASVRKRAIPLDKLFNESE